MGKPLRIKFEEQIPVLYPRLHRSMTAYLSGTGVEPDDVLQEAFLRAYKKMDQFDKQSSLYTWLYAIARNISIDEFRKQKKSPFKSVVPVEEFDVESDDIKDDEIELSEEKLALRKAIANLPELLRSIIIMKIMDGLSYKEIEKVTGVNEQTLKNRMFRAKKELANSLKKMRVDE